MTIRVPTETINLADGLDSRLHSVDSVVPKSMAPDQVRPFTERLMDNRIEQGILRVITPE